jgi:predicted nucleic acid-binding protein
LRLYLDASVLVALHTPDRFQERATGLIDRLRPELLLSDFGAAEFSSAVARMVRTGLLKEPDARVCFDDFDLWSARDVVAAAVESADIRAADGFVRRMDTALRAPDAIHLAVARRLDASLATFDRQLAVAGKLLGVTVAEM